MKSNQGLLQISAHRRALTLVELLVVCVIVVILAGLTLFAVGSVAHSAKVSKTRSTIQKLDTALRQIIEAYEDKFIDIKSKITEEFPKLPSETEAEARERQAAIAAHYIRDIMRMEMPQNAAEYLSDPLEIEFKGTLYRAVEESPLLNYYRKSNFSQTKNPSAALLFLIIQNMSPETLEAFHGSEVTDTDGDGLLEFVDAWGNPIRFLRWAPAFSDSYIQKEEFRFPDPADERVSAAGWFLYPLIYSAGADGKYGIEDAPQPLKIGEDGVLNPYSSSLGKPLNSSHFDNIHNHQWYRSF